MQPTLDNRELTDMTTMVELAVASLHEAYNRIATIRAYAQIAQMHDPGIDDLNPYFEGIIESVDALEDTFRQILLEPQSELRGKKQQMDLDEVIGHVLDLVRPIIEQKKLEVHTPQSNVDLQIDATRGQFLKRALFCLVDNAIDASHRGGQIHVTCHQNTTLHITVADQGHGIPEHIVEDIYTPGFTTKPAGTGLGLFLARQIIQSSLGGTLCLVSSDSNGTTFAVTVDKLSDHDCLNLRKIPG